MRKITILAIVCLISIKAFCQNSESCVDFYSKNIKDISSKNENSIKNYFSVYFSCLEDDLKKLKYAKDSIAYKAFITACFYGQSWRFQNGADAYLKAIENKVQLDSSTKAMALFCWVNSIGTIVLPDGSKVIGEKLNNKLDIFFQLFDDMISMDKTFICLRASVHNKIQNCYEYSNDTLYSKYNMLYANDKKDCDGCCTNQYNDNYQIIAVRKN